MLRQADITMPSRVSRTTSRPHAPDDGQVVRTGTGGVPSRSRITRRLLNARFDRGLWLTCSGAESASYRPMLTGHLVDDDPDTVPGLPWPAACLEEYVCQPVRKRRLLLGGPSRKHLYGDHRHVSDTRQVIASGWSEIGERVLVRRYESWDLNVGLIVGEASCLVVDTRVSPREGRELAQAVRAVTTLPWIIANTHAHLDHVLGNSAFGNAGIWGHIRCADFLREHGHDRLRGLRELDEADRAEAEIVVPDNTFEDVASIDLGQRVVVLRHLGRGHTAGDIVIEVPDAAVLFAGDLIREGGPLWFEDAYPLDWPSTLHALEAVARGAVVPGHGIVVDREFVAGQQAMLTELATAARDAYAAGRSIHDAANILPLKPRIARDALARAYLQIDASR